MSSLLIRPLRDKSLKDATQLHILANQILSQRISMVSLQSLNNNAVETDESICEDSTNGSTDDEDGELSRMSTSDANEQQRISLSLESMEEDSQNHLNFKQLDNFFFTKNSKNLL